MKNKMGFTLAEATIVLVMLGVIAAITIPTLISRQTEIAERTKLKKAWEIYDRIFQTMRADNLMMTKDAFTAWANQPNCPNTVQYFKTVDVDANNGCIFKTPDGIWYDITDIFHPNISLGTPKTDDNTFKFVVSYDQSNLTYKLNDPIFPGLTSDEKSALKKIFAKLNEKVDIKASKWLSTFMLGCYTDGYCYSNKYKYDDFGHITIEYTGCKADGTNCSSTYKNEYDSNGNRTINYYYCDKDASNCGGSTKYNYDEHGNVLSYFSCDGNGENCSFSYYYKYDYDKDGKILVEYGDCGSSGNICTTTRKYDYDKDGNKVAEYGCDGKGNNCRYSYKYNYDDDGNQIAYYRCDGSGNNCSYSYKYDYDSYGNKIADYNYCDGNGYNCSYSTKYEYDANNRKTIQYNSCDADGNNCSYSYKYEYDENGNMKYEYQGCDANGNNCTTKRDYSYVALE